MSVRIRPASPPDAQALAALLATTWASSVPGALVAPRVIARQLPPKAWNHTESCVRELALGAPASETDHRRRW